MSDRWFRDGRLHFGVGIEDTFIPQEQPGHRKLDLYELTQHYENWRDDLSLAADSGAELIRWGIPWYLTEPRDGEFDFRWIDEVAEHMRTVGLRCVVDLMHYGTPMWLENEFLNPRYPEVVARYAGEVATRYAGVFDDFTPLNEPMINAQWCGQTGKWPPYLTGHSGFLAVALPLVLGLQASHRAIVAANPEASIVHVEAGFRWSGNRSTEEKAFLDQWRFLMADLMLGRVDETHLLWPYLMEHGACRGKLRRIREGAVTPDVFGINYYPAFTTQSVDLATGADLPCETGTAGLVDLVRAYADRYDFPFAITETSRIDTDPGAKIAWINDLTRTIDELRSSGVDMVAAFWFPFLDMYEWEYRFATDPLDEHYKPFGLVDFVRGPDNQLRRVPNAAFEHFRQVVAARAQG